MVEKMVVFRGLYLGDLVAATPALRALRRGHPAAEISLVGLPWAAALAPHLVPDIDRFVSYPGAPGLDGEDDEAALESFVREMRAEDFDLAVSLHGRGPQSTRLVARFGARRVAGFVGGSGEYPSLNVSVRWDAEEHEGRKLLLLAEATGGVSDGESARHRLRVRDEDHRRTGELLGRNTGGPLALLHPGASVEKKRWCVEGFGGVARGLIHRGYSVAITGSKGERGISKRVRELAPGALDLSGKTDLHTLIGLVSRAALLVSNDTGPAHLAYALATPSVTVFGPSTDVERWGPLDRTRHAVLLGDPISEVGAEAVLESAGSLVVGGQRMGV